MNAKNAGLTRIVGALVLIVVAAQSTRTAAEDTDQIEQLRFLTGAWGADDAIVEYWLSPLRGLMVGINRSREGEGRPFFEYLRIESRADGIFYVASPKGVNTTSFKLTEISSHRVVFENPAHDFPQKIIYTRTGDHLEAEVGATQDGKWRSFKLSWLRQP